MMTRPSIRLLFAGVLLAVSLAHAQETPSLEADTQAVRGTVQQYFKGHATADQVEMRKAFLPTAHIEGIREGVFSSWTIDDYGALSKHEPAQDENTRTRTINRVDITGNAAMVSATLVHGATTYPDCLLPKVNGEWKIANKIYESQRVQ